MNGKARHPQSVFKDRTDCRRNDRNQKKMQQTIELIELVATRIQHAEEETKRMAEQL